MVRYTVEADSLDEIGSELHDLGVVGGDAAWRDLVDTLERLLEGVAQAHEHSDGAGMSRSKVALYADLEDQYDGEAVGTMLDVLVMFGYVDQDGRRYRLDARGEDVLR